MIILPNPIPWPPLTPTLPAADVIAEGAEDIDWSAWDVAVMAGDEDRSREPMWAAK